nr:uncharacterized protein LOC129523596 isoform X2 [Gorilla gorilla gorilla]
MGAVGRWGTMGELTRSLDVLDPIREGRAEQVGHSSLVSGETLHLPNLHSVLCPDLVPSGGLLVSLTSRMKPRTLVVVPTAWKSLP